MKMQERIMKVFWYGLADICNIISKDYEDFNILSDN